VTIKEHQSDILHLVDALDISNTQGGHRWQRGYGRVHRNTSLTALAWVCAPTPTQIVSFSDSYP
jgi:hypothetical protein